jgi:hypothetical protein
VVKKENRMNRLATDDCKATVKFVRKGSEEEAEADLKCFEDAAETSWVKDGVHYFKYKYDPDQCVHLGRFVESEGPAGFESVSGRGGASTSTTPGKVTK